MENYNSKRRNKTNPVLELTKKNTKKINKKIT